MGQCTKYDFKLTPESIEKAFEYFSRLTPKDNEKLKNYKKMCLASETVLNIWAKKLGGNTPCQVVARSQFGRKTVEFHVPGYQLNPIEEKDELLTLVVNGSSIFSRLGIVPEYNYTKGYNNLKLWIPKKDSNDYLLTILAIVLAVILGFGLKTLAPEVAGKLSEKLFAPVMEVLTRTLSALCGPLVFLSVCSGIFGLDNINSFKKIGGKLLGILVAGNLFTELVALAFTLPLVKIETVFSSSGNETLGELIKMFVDMVPSDIVSPVETGNTIQIIVLAFAFALGVLFLGASVPDLKKITSQLEDLINVLFATFNKFLPVLVFTSIISLFLTDSTQDDIKGAFVTIFLITAASSVLIELILLVVLKFRYKTNIKALLKSQAPYTLIAFATASSSAVTTQCLESCKNDLGMESNFANVSVPIGQVFSSTPLTGYFISFALILAANSGISITISKLLTTLISVLIVCTSAPPVAGISTTIVLMLFNQLGIPADNIGLAIGISILADYFTTGFKVLMLPQQLLLISPQK